MGTPGVIDEVARQVTLSGQAKGTVDLAPIPNS
jgi:hypothetical protein